MGDVDQEAIQSFTAITDTSADVARDYLAVRPPRRFISSSHAPWMKTLFLQEKSVYLGCPNMQGPGYRLSQSAWCFDFTLVFT